VAGLGQQANQSSGSDTTKSKAQKPFHILTDAEILANAPPLPAVATVYGIGIGSLWLGIWPPNREVKYDGFTIVYNDAGIPIEVKRGTYGVIPWYVTGPGEIMEGLKMLEEVNEEVQFGKTANQIYHATKHLEEAGLSADQIAEIKGAIMKDVSRIAKQLKVGEDVTPFTIKVNNITVTYNAYRLPNGVINVGRITIP
jgi:hypothetical protein